MSVTPLLREDKLSLNALYVARKHYGLTLTQAAKALNLSATQLEREELRPRPTIDMVQATQAFSGFVLNDADGKLGKNLLYSSMPIRVARDILGENVEQIAKRYDISPSQWKKMECHARKMPQSLIEQIESDIRKSFSALCRSQSETVICD